MPPTSVSAPTTQTVTKPSETDSLDSLDDALKEIDEVNKRELPKIKVEVPPPPPSQSGDCFSNFIGAVVKVVKAFV